ncbi:MAG: ABC transporter ATP-binding protein [Clostridiales bacterium]|nr:ABC transporter ATP-binding protein [Clostridiales bacterium]
MALLTCEGVSLRYDRVTVVDHLSFSLSRGDYLCVVGENGSGKSSLVKAILGLMPLAGGTIRLGEGLRRSHIGYLPQQTARQRDFPAGVQEIVLSGCLNRMGLRPFYSTKEKHRAAQAMERLGVYGMRRESYHELSGGQQQRVLLARALCATQSMLLLDEPVAGLDPLATAEFYRLIAELNREDQVTILMISHDIDAAVTCASHILHLSGEPLFFGSAQAYRESEAGRRFLKEGSHA